MQAYDLEKRVVFFPPMRLLKGEKHYHVKVGDKGWTSSHHKAFILHDIITNEQ